MKEKPIFNESREALGQAVEQKFLGIATSALIRRMEKAEAFGSDDEEVELTNRLAAEGKTWRWAGDFFNPRVVIEGGE